MHALVIGGTGFIGSHIVDRLVADGHRVRSLSRRAERFRDPVPGVDYQFGRLDDRMTVIEALTDIDTVFHLASTTFPGTAELDPVADVRDNLVATIDLMDAMLGLGIRRLVYMSSGGTVYGIPEIVPTPEDHPLRPRSSYGIVKCAIEQYLDLYRRTHGLSPVVVRASNPFGPRQGHTGVQGVVATFLRRLRDDAPIEVWGDGSVVRDYFYVRDLADFTVRAAASGTEGPLNAGSGTGVSLNNLIAEMGRVAGREITPVYKAARAIDVPRSVLDIARARDVLGWAPETPLADGLAATWDWVRSS